MGGAVASRRACWAQLGIVDVQRSGNVRSTTGAKITGIAADAATAFAMGYDARSLQIAPKVSSLNTNGVRLKMSEALIQTRGRCSGLSCRKVAPWNRLSSSQRGNCWEPFMPPSYACATLIGLKMLERDLSVAHQKSLTKIAERGASVQTKVGSRDRPALNTGQEVHVIYQSSGRVFGAIQVRSSSASTP